MKYIITTIIIGALFFIGCKDEPTDPNKNRLSANTSKSVFRTADTIQVNIVNDRENAAFFTQCTRNGVEYGIQRFEDTQWNLYTMAACNVYAEAGNYRIEPGTVFSQTLFVDTPGEYRLFFRFGYERRTITDTIYTNRFTMTE
jgi:hypothetical protein